MPAGMVWLAHHQLQLLKHGCCQYLSRVCGHNGTKVVCRVPFFHPRAATSNLGQPLWPHPKVTLRFARIASNACWSMWRPRAWNQLNWKYQIPRSTCVADAAYMLYICLFALQGLFPKNMWPIIHVRIRTQCRRDKLKRHVARSCGSYWSSCSSSSFASRAEETHVALKNRTIGLLWLPGFRQVFGDLGIFLVHLDSSLGQLHRGFTGWMVDIFTVLAEAAVSAVWCMNGEISVPQKIKIRLLLGIVEDLEIRLFQFRGMMVHGVSWAGMEQRTIWPTST